MLPSVVRNQLSARSEVLNQQLAQVAIDHRPAILPFEEEERWLSRRSQVLNLQLRLLRESAAAPDSLELQVSYEHELEALKQEIIARYREMIEARMSDTHDVIMPREDGDGFVVLDAQERDRRIARFRERLDGEMALARVFSFGPPEGRAQRIDDLQQEWRGIEDMLDQLKQRMDEINFPFVDTSATLSGSLTRVRKDTEEAVRDTNAHERWLNACREGDLVQVLMVLDTMVPVQRKEFINRWGEGGRNGFHFACEANNYVVASLLLRFGADLYTHTDRGRLPVHLAVRRDCGEQSRTFLTWLKMAGASFDVRNPDQKSPLDEAAHYNNLTAVRWLLEQGAAVDQEDRLGRTALHVAAADGHAELVAYLLTQGADLHHINGVGERPLVEALLHGREAVAQLFWDHGQWLTAAETASLQRSHAWRSAGVRCAYAAPLRGALANLPQDAQASATETQAPLPLAPISRFKQRLSSLLP